MAELPKFSHISGIGVEEDNDDVKFQIISRNTAVLCMCNEHYAI